MITRIKRSVPFGDHVRLFVKTDRGETDFTVDTEDIYRLSGNRILLKDMNGIRYPHPRLAKDERPQPPDTGRVPVKFCDTLIGRLLL